MRACMSTLWSGRSNPVIGTPSDSDPKCAVAISDGATAMLRILGPPLDALAGDATPLASAVPLPHPSTTMVAAVRPSESAILASRKAIARCCRSCIVSRRKWKRTALRLRKGDRRYVYVVERARLIGLRGRQCKLCVGYFELRRHSARIAQACELVRLFGLGDILLLRRVLPAGARQIRLGGFDVIRDLFARLCELRLRDSRLCACKVDVSLAEQAVE